MDDNIRIEDVKSCPTCGHAVVIRGKITKKFIPVSDAKMDELELKKTIKDSIFHPNRFVSEFKESKRDRGTVYRRLHE